MNVIEKLTPLWCKAWKGTDISLEIVRFEERGDVVVAVARTVVFEDGLIRDIKEQEVSFGDAADYDDDERDGAAAAAFDVVAGAVVGGMTRQTFELLMPADLVCGDLAGLGNCEAQAQFEKALKTKKRLGRWLV